MRLSAYLIINIFFFLFLGVGFAYSWFFYPNTHPIDCAFRQKTGKDCPSCGISRSFSSFTHARWNEGTSYNSKAGKIFVFFLVQFTYRSLMIFLEAAMKRKITPMVIKMDIVFSLIHLLVAFLPMLSQ